MEKEPSNLKKIEDIISAIKSGETISDPCWDDVLEERKKSDALISLVEKLFAALEVSNTLLNRSSSIMNQATDVIAGLDKKIKILKNENDLLRKVLRKDENIRSK